MGRKISFAHLEEGKKQLVSSCFSQPPAEEQPQAVLHLCGRPVRVNGDAGGHGGRCSLLEAEHRLSIKDTADG